MILQTCFIFKGVFMAKKKGARRPASKGKKSRRARKARSAARARQREQKTNNMYQKIGINRDMSNEQVKEHIKKASKGESAAMSQSTAKSFWALTRDIWNRDDVKSSDRLDAIMEYFGTNNMAEAMALAFEEAGKKFLEETGRVLDIYRYSVNSFFGAGFFSMG